MTDYSRSNILLPHFEEAEAFLNALDGKDAQFTFQTFDDVEVWSDEKQKNIKRQHKDLVRIYHGTFNEHKQTLAAINKRGGGVFVTINETDLKGRKKENILKVRAVFVDLDGSPIQPILDLEEDLQPHIIIESSPNKWHAYWLVDNCSLELFPLVQRALAAKFNGDISVNNIDRVMRLTGFSHNKGESFITRIHTMQDNLYPYSVNKLIVGLGLELEQPTHKKQTFTHANTGDFEAVKRAAQGRWPAIFGRIGITLPPDNNHAPCPACGGTDRFRYDDIDGHGTFICNRGGNGILSGDGFALIQHKTGVTSSEALNMVRGIVMPDYQKSEKYQSSHGSEPNTPQKQSFAYGGGFFEVSLKGVFYLDDENKYNFVCSPLWVKAKTRTGQGEAWGRLLEWLDDDGNVHQWAMPLELLEGDCADVRRELAHKGVSIEPSKKGRDRLAIYLKKSPVEDRALCVERLGWYDDVYILPKKVIGSSKEIIVFQNPHGIETAFAQSGTVEQWRDNVSRFAIGNTRFLLALSFAFGACLFELSQAESGGIHFLGASSIGKSTFLDGACSTWGKPKNYKREWRNTANAIEGLCSLHNNGLLVLDEINQADIKTIGQTIYMIVNGQSKGRMSKNGTTRPVSRWNTPFLSGGEKTLEALLKESGQTINAGQAVRLANVRALVGKHGAFEQLHGLESGDTLSKLIKTNANKYYGTVGITWLEYIAANKENITNELDSRIKAWLNTNVPKGASGQVSRVASRFALIGIAGELATKQGLTGWPTGAANDAAKVCFDDWLLSFGGISNHEDRAILAHVKAFFEAHGSSRFEALEQMSGDKVEKVINRVGFWQYGDKGKEYIVFQEAFKNEICKGFDVKQVIRVLSGEDILIKDKEGYSTQTKRIPESPKPTRMYVINADMLFSTCNSRNTCNNDDFKQDFSVTASQSEPVTPVTETQAPTAEKVVTETCYSRYRSQENTCNTENTNKINVVTAVTAVTGKKHDILKNSQNLGFSFDESVIGEV